MEQPQHFPTLLELARFRVVKELWGTRFREYRKDIQKNHEMVNRQISSIPSHQLSGQLVAYLLEGSVLLKRAYCELIQWQRRYGSPRYLGLHHVIFCLPWLLPFFTIDGHFNDVGFVKWFVSGNQRDTRTRIRYRFLFACDYCLEDDVLFLWEQLKKEKKLCKENVSLLARLWICKLEDKLNDFVLLDLVNATGVHLELIDEEWDNVPYFHHLGLILAVVYGYEPATYYFWSHLSYTEREYLVEKHCLGNLLKEAALSNRFKIVNILYSQLDYGQKTLLLTSQTEKMQRVWCCLLDSPFGNSIFNEILNYPYPIPPKLLSGLVDHFHFRKNVINMQAFAKLWKSMPRETQLYILKNNRFALSMLSESNELVCVEVDISWRPPEESTVQ